MKKIFLLLICLFFVSALSAQKKNVDKRLAGLDTFVNRILSDWHAAGVGIAVVEKDKVIYTNGFGYRDYERKLPVTENTLFAIGSCTKAFTASLLGMLVKENKLDLDKPVHQYLPELVFKEDYMTGHVTPRDMMCHRTGLPRHDLAWYGSSRSREDLVKAIRYFEPSAELRQRWQYNNFMFLAQGVLAEKLFGEKWEKLVKEKIFNPLGMTSSDFSVTDLEKSPDHSLGYRVKDKQVKVMKYMNIDAIGPAGSINSSAKDMANWVITWINGGKFKDSSIIPSTYASQAMSSQMVIGPGLPTKETPDVYFSTYGFGWFLASYRGHYRVEHGGNIDGFSASTSFFPTDSIGIVVLTNQNGSSVPAIIRNGIAERMLKLPLVDWSGRLMEATKKAEELQKQKLNTDSINRKPNTTPSHDLSAYTGTYSAPGYGKVKLEFKDGKLIGHYGTLDFDLKHYHYDIFNMVITNEDVDADDEAFMKISFHTNLKGEIETFTVPLESSVKDIEFKKEVEEIEVKKNDLEKYVGEYTLGPQTIRFEIRGDSTLWGTVAGQPDYEMMAIGPDEFKFKILTGFSVKFTVNEKGEVTDAVFTQPNGTFKATKKK